MSHKNIDENDLLIEYLNNYPIDVKVLEIKDGDILETVKKHFTALRAKCSSLNPFGDNQMSASYDSINLTKVKPFQGGSNDTELQDLLKSFEKDFDSRKVTNRVLISSI